MNPYFEKFLKMKFYDRYAIDVWLDDVNHAYIYFSIQSTTLTQFISTHVGSRSIITFAKLGTLVTLQVIIMEDSDNLWREWKRPREHQSLFLCWSLWKIILDKVIFCNLYVGSPVIITKRGICKAGWKSTKIYDILTSNA